MKISVRGWFVVGAFAAGVAAMAIMNSPLVDAAPPRAKPAGQLTEESLGRALASLGLTPKKQDQRYDFAFKAKQDKQEWDLSMSAVLSEDGQSIWVMAWLDELPRSAAEVPRTALLRLLSDNDRLGGGKFFAYVSGNRRFVLQRVIANQNITADGFRTMLGDLGRSVVDTHSHWSVASWKSGGKGQPSAAQTASGQKTSTKK